MAQTTAHPTTPGPAPEAARTRRYTRDDVLRFGRTAPPWEFIPVAVVALRAAPDDPAVRFHFAAALGRLGLRTLALEQLAAAERRAGADPAIAALRSAIEPLPDDLLPHAARLANLAGNLEALGRRAADLLPHVDRWRTAAREERAYRAIDGNIVRRAADHTDPSTWRHLADHAGAAARFADQHLGPAHKPAAPITLEGIDPPWLLRRIDAATPPDAAGFQPRLLLLQADPLEALDGLSLADLRNLLASPRCILLAGPDAAARLGAWMRARLDQRLTGPYIPMLGVRTPIPEPGRAEITGALAAQAREAAELRAELASRDASRTTAVRAARLDHALGDAASGRPPAEPLRVLLPTCRFTTFLQHAAADLAEAFRSLGHHAEILIEPDDHTQLSTISYLRELERLDPDLVVMINYTRAQVPDVIPPGVPVVCWAQDLMPHLFTPESGAAQGPMDFLAGHADESLFTRCGFSRDRVVASPVVASESKFHTGPIDPDLRARFDCEIACVMHHSPTPEALHDRLKRESARDPHAAQVLDRLLPLCIDIATRSIEVNPYAALRDAVARTLREHHPLGDHADIQGATLRQYALPVADRAFRHQALQWAAAVARRRGWRLRLHGKGWESHPTLAPLAAGPVEHGEHLRACYAAARVHLHLCLSTLMHQRTFECALSGGLPILRPVRDSLAALHSRAKLALADSGAVPFGAVPDLGGDLYSFADSTESLQYAAATQRLGVPLQWPGVLIQPERLPAMRRLQPSQPLETDPSWVFGDLAQIAFTDEASLETLVDRAIDRPDWRDAVSASIAGRVRQRLTHAALARRLLEAMRDRAAAIARP